MGEEAKSPKCYVYCHRIDGANATTAKFNKLVCAPRDRKGKFADRSSLTRLFVPLQIEIPMLSGLDIHDAMAHARRGSYRPMNLAWGSCSTRPSPSPGRNRGSSPIRSKGHDKESLQLSIWAGCLVPGGRSKV